MSSPFVSVVNSSDDPLLAAGVFQGVQEDVSGYASVSVFIFTDQASAADGLELQFSTNGTDWDTSETHTIALGVAASFIVPVEAQFFRVVLTNGGVGQTLLRLQTIFHGAAVASRVAAGIAYTDRSLQITLGGTAETLMAANPTRKTLGVGNPMENMEIIWVSPVTTAAVQGLGSIPIFPGGMWEPYVAPLSAISVLAPTTGTNVSAWEA